MSTAPLRLNIFYNLNASKVQIIFFQEDLSDDVVALNIPNGAHHSDLNHNEPSDKDTPDVTAARAKALELIKKWLAEENNKLYSKVDLKIV